jgi:hypothetical protein
MGSKTPLIQLGSNDPIVSNRWPIIKGHCHRAPPVPTCFRFKLVVVVVIVIEIEIEIEIAIEIAIGPATRSDTDAQGKQDGICSRLITDRSLSITTTTTTTTTKIQLDINTNNFDGALPPGELA